MPDRPNSNTRRGLAFWCVPLGISVFWATMMGLLIRREVLPAWQAAAPVGYGGLLAPRELQRHAEFGIYFRGQRVGFSQTTIRAKGNGGLTIVGETRISIGQLSANMLKWVPAMRAYLSIDVGPDEQLQRFAIVIRGPLKAWVRGHALGKQLHVVTKIGNRPIVESDIPFDARMLLGMSFGPVLSNRHIRVGKRWTLMAYDPLRRGFQRIDAEVTERERILVASRPVEAFVIRMRYGSMSLRSWVNERGELLRQELPFGLMMVRETQKRDFATRRDETIRSEGGR